MFTWIAAKLGSTLLEYVVGALVAALLAGSLYYTGKYAWDAWFVRPKLEKQLKDEQEKNVNLRLDNFRLGAENADKAKTAVVRTRYVHVAQKLDAMVQLGDHAAMRDYYIKHGMLRDPGPGVAAPGPAGRSGH